MPDGFDQLSWPSAAHLPPHLKRLHELQAQAIREQREADADPDDFDADGRYWPGMSSAAS